MYHIDGRLITETSDLRLYSSESQAFGNWRVACTSTPASTPPASTPAPQARLQPASHVHCKAPLAEYVTAPHPACRALKRFDENSVPAHIHSRVSPMQRDRDSVCVRMCVCLGRPKAFGQRANVQIHDVCVAMSSP